MNTVITLHPRSGRPQFNGQVQSGDFGSDRGLYIVLVELYGRMVRHITKDGQKWWITRAEAWAASKRASHGHTAVIGI